MMDKKDEKTISKFLSFVLRHQPAHIDLSLNSAGWANVDELLQKIQPYHPISFSQLEEIVANNSKKRFAFNEDKTKIRASQGHSIDIDLALHPLVPPVTLLHGTVESFLESIRKEGLLKMSRQYVHLSADESTAKNVGSRRGVPVLLTIQSKQMFDAGYVFYLSENTVWLTEYVPPSFIIFPT